MFKLSKTLIKILHHFIFAFFFCSIGYFKLYGDVFEENLIFYLPVNFNSISEGKVKAKGTVRKAKLSFDRYDMPSRCFEFNGENSIVYFGNDSLLNFKNEITIGAWIYPKKVKSQIILQKGREHIRSGVEIHPSYSLSLSEDILYSLNIFDKNLNKYKVISLVHDGYKINKWILVVGTYSGELMRLYVNGKLKKEKWVKGEIGQNYLSLVIGGNNTNPEYFYGKIDEIKIFKKALNIAEINFVYYK